jgi:hypothetical protein
VLKHALKEWALICEALAEGRQAILLRKGGIAEPDGDFHLKQTRFWLFPTYVHQQNTGIKPEAAPLLEKVGAARPRQGIVRLAHFADVAGVYELHDMVGALRVRDLHLWSDETVQSRFRYRRPGLHLLVVRIYRATEVYELADTETYAGCRSWVELERELSTAGATPVLADEAFHRVVHKIEDLLNPTALA